MGPFYQPRMIMMINECGTVDEMIIEENLP
jgi:hypothetical protein